MSFTETLQGLTGKPLADCTNQELYLALLELVRQKSADRVQPVTGRKLYYISAEFLIGKLLSNNLINLGLYDEARMHWLPSARAFPISRRWNRTFSRQRWSGPSGGLLPGFAGDAEPARRRRGPAVSLRPVPPVLEDGVQNEKPDPWLTAHSWAEKTDTTYPVELAGKGIHGTPVQAGRYRLRGPHQHPEPVSTLTPSTRASSMTALPLTRPPSTRT